MGREIRMVPPNWEHPKKEEYNSFEGKVVERFQPKYEENYDEALKEWNEGIVLWNQGKHPKQIEHKEKIESGDLYEFDNKEAQNRMNNPGYYLPENGYNYWDYYGNPPTEEYCVPYTEDECEWVQVYETVSEGTPVTPPFATKAELVDYLVENGDFWDQRRGHGGWSRESAETFVESGWRPTGVMQGGNVKMARDM